MTTMRLIRALPLLLLAGASAACDTNQAGDLRATASGDLSIPLPPRAPAVAELTAACQMTPAVIAPESGLRRRPFLQRLKARSVDVVWTADQRLGGAASVAVRRPDGSEVTRAPAVPDASAHPFPNGTTQWIAAVTGLSPDTTYCYDLVAPGGQVLRRAGFRTAPAFPPASASPATPGRPLRLVVLGDSGDGSDDQLAVRTQLSAFPFDLLLHLGDIAYPSGRPVELESLFFSVYADLLELIPAFPTSGNHEYLTDDAAPYREAFVLPENGGPYGRERWYSHDWGDVHFVALDSERVGPVQAAWLDADLAANRRPWTIVYLHRPAFSSGDHGGDRAVQEHFVPLFVKHRVPLVLAGHDHHYERTTPQDGVTYVVSGGGGRGTRPVGRSAFTAFAEQVCNFLYLTVDGGVLTLHAIDGTGQVFDSLRLIR